MSRRLSSGLRLLCVVLVAVLTIQSAAFTGAYFTAFRYLQRHDPLKGTSRSEMRVYFRPKTLARGEEADRSEFVRHLAAIGFQQREGSDAGTFSVGVDSTLVINSRLPEFPSAAISFRRGRVASISVGGREAERVEVEPQPMVSFLRFMPDEVSRRARVRRTTLPPDGVPEVLSDAVCSSEDTNFYENNGLDEVGMFIRGLSGHGGSGVTQQLMKVDVLDDSSRTLGRKAREAFLALAATRLMTKKEIMAAYGSAIYLGHVPGGPDIYGFAAAAHEYFGVSDLNRLTLGQSAVLAGMIDLPAVYVSRARSGDYAPLLARRARVLKLMRRNYPDKYTEEVIARANAEPLEFYFASQREEEKPLDMVSRHFQNFAASQAQRVVDASTGAENVRVYTSAEPELQVAAHDAVISHLSRLDGLVAAACREQGVDPTVVEPIQAALVALDTQTGEILAMAGGRNSDVNFAARPRSPGSAVKPFVFLKAVESGRHGGLPFTAATIIDPRHDPVHGAYRPQHHVGVTARARVQLAASYNGGAVVAANDAGLSQTRDLIFALTRSRVDELTGMLAIGGAAGSEVKLLDLVSGYTVFPTNGMKVAATPFTTVYQNGVKVNVPGAAPARVAGEAPAYIVTQMMRSVVRPGGTAPAALSLAGLPADAPVAGKTGSGQVADLAFVGFSPRVVVGVFVMMPKNAPALRIMDGFSGGRTAMPIWAEFMRAVGRHRPDLLRGDFTRPQGVEVLRVDPDRGCVVGAGGVEEFFVEGRTPEPCYAR
jgi:membrane peptidoglycan carboxypeptidase